jgi:hypothetical protein
MTKRAVLILTLLFLSPIAARAEPIPDGMLDKEYTTCMGGETAKTDADRARYCLCVRNAMKSWDLDTYGKVASEQAAKGNNPENVAPQIQDIGKSCIQQVLGTQ